MRLLLYLFVIVQYILLLEGDKFGNGYEWWRKYTDEELWVQGNRADAGPHKLHDPREFSKIAFYDIAFVIDQSKLVEDSDLKPMYDGLHEYVKMFKYFGYRDGYKQCNRDKLIGDSEGYTCFAIWRCTVTGKIEMQFRDTPKDIKDVIIKLQPPREPYFYENVNTKKCLTNARMMYDRENGDRLEDGQSGKNLIFFITACSTRLSNEFRTLGNFGELFIICAKSTKHADFLGSVDWSKLPGVSHLQWSNLAAFMELLSRKASTVIDAMFLDCRFTVQQTSCIYNVQNLRCEKYKLALVDKHLYQDSPSNYGKPCPTNISSSCDAKECRCDKNAWKIVKPCSVSCGKGEEQQIRDVSHNPTCEPKQTVECTLQDCPKTTTTSTTTTTITTTTNKQIPTTTTKKQIPTTTTKKPIATTTMTKPITTTIKKTTTTTSTKGITTSAKVTATSTSTAAITSATAGMTSETSMMSTVKDSNTRTTTMKETTMEKLSFSASTTSSSTEPITSENKDAKMKNTGPPENLGVIIGGVIAGVVLLLLIVAIVVALVVRNRKAVREKSLMKPKSAKGKPVGGTKGKQAKKVAKGHETGQQEREKEFKLKGLKVDIKEKSEKEKSEKSASEKVFRSKKSPTSSKKASKKSTKEANKSTKSSKEAKKSVKETKSAKKGAVPKSKKSKK